VFITLESPTFCNKWIRFTESTEGLITLQGNLKIYYISSLVHIIYVRLLSDEVQLFFFVSSFFNIRIYATNKPTQILKLMYVNNYLWKTN